MLSTDLGRKEGNDMFEYTNERFFSNCNGDTGTWNLLVSIQAKFIKKQTLPSFAFVSSDLGRNNGKYMVKYRSESVFSNEGGHTGT